MKPVVNRIESLLGDEAQVMRLNILEAEGRKAAMLYAVRAVPTIVVIDACGNEAAVYVGFASAQQVVNTVKTLPACEP